MDGTQIVQYFEDEQMQAVTLNNEEGTTAGAVTMMVMNTRSLPRPPEVFFEMICDRPFVFVLHKDNHVLFTGVVNKP